MTDRTALVCPGCGSSGIPGDVYCELCGRTLSSSSASSTPAAPRASCVACGAPGDDIEEGYCRICGIKQPGRRDRLTGVDGNGRVAAVTDRGRRRRRNEDAFAISSLADGRIVAVVSDGVSSTTDSDLASEEAVQAAVAALLAHADRDPSTALRAAYAAAVDAVTALASDSTAPPSCTFLAAAAAGHSLELVSMGDCRAFWLPDNGEPQTLTQDDSWAAEQILAKTMTVEQAHADTRAHGITRWLGRDADPSWEPRRVQLTAAGPGRLVMCSDGLWNYTLSVDELAAAAGDGPPATVARRLVDYANDCGGQDNTTVVVIAIPCHADAPSSKGVMP